MEYLTMDYEFDKTPLNRSQRHPVRSVVIFSVVLAVTAGIVYCIVPHGGEKASGGKPSVADAVVRPGVPDAAEKERTRENQTPEIPNEENSANTADAAAAAGSDDPASKKEEKPTDAPVKGVPWSGDPAVDQPEKPLPAETLDKENALSEANREALRRKGSEWLVSHTVSRGDNLERLARRYHTTPTAIREMNRLKSDVIYLGAKLKIAPGPWKIEISKSARRLRLFNLARGEERLFAAYDVGIGRAGSTPTGDFVIAFRLYHPDYLAPNGAVFPYGAEENPLGDYFLKLAPEKAKDKPLAGYGIHGAPDDAGVGRSLSHGCIRMRNENVQELYLLCPAGTAVHVAD
ncbi:MAG: L,D-transpeptidase family protein [Victivallaceae bacterium]|nr:L,D-transpeptidase family protein [Victivallaceae bacterium]